MTLPGRSQENNSKIKEKTLPKKKWCPRKFTAEGSCMLEASRLRPGQRDPSMSPGMMQYGRRGLHGMAGQSFFGRCRRRRVEA